MAGPLIGQCWACTLSHLNYASTTDGAKILLIISFGAQHRLQAVAERLADGQCVLTASQQSKADTDLVVLLMGARS